ncbi:hypothetical protein KPL70_025295 [Citrus sinensis]|uniref:receptor-like protein EIX1 n=1 Tax=Citrus sinensis TaxID=2711 RepID=UPI00219EE8F7|nr:receptor-like protein EIX1 [Citrus sinensis]KAH9647719.1 hypothetical protein KPL70_025295 [Citrus sinensis]
MNGAICLLGEGWKIDANGEVSTVVTKQAMQSPLDLRTYYLSGFHISLEDLQSINIGLNAIRVRKFDQWLSYHNKLTSLSLQGLDLREATDWLQVVITGLPSLRELDLSSSAPPKINYRSHSLVNSSSSSLTHLHLSLCGLSNSAYHCLSHISKSLVYLDLSNNQLQGPTPDYAFRNMTSLASLTSLNYITGISKFSLPITLVRPKYAFSNVTSLMDLDLSKNQITGIPKSFGDMCCLKTLKIHDNILTAKLPELFLNFSAGCAKKSLQSFMLQNNMLSGSLPGVTEF